MSDTKQSPEAYSGLETQPIGGRRRAGRSARSLIDTDPFTGSRARFFPATWSAACALRKLSKPA
jgi:hypothetical protein